MTSKYATRLMVVPVFFIVFPAALFADHIQLKNGDTVTGSIVKKDGAKLTFKSEFLGEVTVPWTAVTSISSDTDVTVAAPDGKTITGKLSTEGATLQVTSAAGAQSVPLGSVSALRNGAEQHAYERLEHPGWLALWAGYFDLGFALTRGNARADTLTTAFNATRTTRKDKTTLYFNEIYASALSNGKSATVADSARGGLAYNRDLSPHLFVNVFNDYAYDRFQALDLRFVAGGGLGLIAIKHERMRLDVLGGGDYERESFTGLQRNSGEAYAGDDLTYKVSGLTNLTQSFRIFPNLTDTGQYRVNFDLGTVTTLKKWLGWNVTVSDRFLTNPILGHQKNDLILTTGLRVSFAR